MELYHFSGNWVALAVSITSEDVNYTYYSSQTPSFSTFAIAGLRTPSVGNDTHANQVDSVLPDTIIQQNESTQGSSSENTPPPESRDLKWVWIALCLVVLIVFFYLFWRRKKKVVKIDG